jgi:hypothetical protein
MVQEVPPGIGSIGTCGRIDHILKRVRRCVTGREIATETPAQGVLLYPMEDWHF